jgi:ubiquinone/menaquinone biosynthesis C-methylase UbiE
MTTTTVDRNPTSRTTGIVLHWPASYDLLAWLMMRGREHMFREKVLDLACLRPGESILDVGCGTGTLAIAAKRRVGPTGTVHGVDASPVMIARAGKKARKTGVEVLFTTEVVEALPFPDAQFDVVLNTLMLHHLSQTARQECASEMRRVLKPGGRVLVVDFGEASRARKSFFAHFPRHGHVGLVDMTALLNEAGFHIAESGPMGIRNFHFVLADAANGAS